MTLISMNYFTSYVQRCIFRLMKRMLLILLLLLSLNTIAQEIISLNSGEKISIRGLSVVDDQIIWASGSQGKVGLSTDGGQHWSWNQIKGFEKTDFRDIEGFDARTAIIMGIDSPGVVLKTYNGGQSWKLVYRDDRSGVFMDAMEFWENGNGIIIGDPINAKPYILRTSDFGNSWIPYTDHKISDFKMGEALFASSGTNVRAISTKEAVMITGGTFSRILVHEKWYDLPILQGQNSTGANSIAVTKGKWIVVGGDFMRDTLRVGNSAISNDGKTWRIPTTSPHGYRSCVEFIGQNMSVACGTSGVDISTDNGENWTLISQESYHVVRKAKKGNAIFLAGAKGRIAKLKL